MVSYDPDKDQSERFGWKKVKDEHRATEQEQNLWSKITAIFGLKLALIPIFLEI